MAEQHLEIGIVVARRSLKNEWIAFAWSPLSVLAAAPNLQGGVMLSHSDDGDTFFAGPAMLTFYASETAHYRVNLLSENPSVWVALGPEEVFPTVSCVTVDPYEGEALAETYAERLEALRMPGAVRDELERFVAAHHVERAFVKRKRL